MWIATTAGLIEWRDRIVRTLTTRDGLPSDVVLAVHEDRKGRVWIGTDRGLAYLDRGGTLVVERAVPADVPVPAIFEDSEGVLWVGATGRLFRLRPGDSRERGEGFGGQVARAAGGVLLEARFASGADTEPGRATVFTEDREGHVWFGVQEGSGGLHRLARERVSTLAHDEGLPCDNAGAVTQAADDTIWIATLCRDGRGIAALRDGRLTEYSGPQYVASLLAEHDGTVWAGTFSGHLFRLQANHFVEVPSPALEGNDDIAVLYRHEDGALWLGTNRGLIGLHDRQWTRLRTTDGLVSDNVVTIVGGENGSMWIGTDLGVSRYHEGRFTNYGAADGVPPGPVRAIHVDAEGVVWIGTYGGGLARFKDGTFTAYGVQGGVLDSSVHRILEDEDGFLWLTGDRGIRRASKRDLHAIADERAAALQITLYDETDGMPSVECNGMAQPAGWPAPARSRSDTQHRPSRDRNRCSSDIDWMGRTRVGSKSGRGASPITRASRRGSTPSG